MSKPGPRPIPVPPEWVKPINGWDEWMTVRGLTPQTRYGWRHKVLHLARVARKPPERVTAGDIMHYMSRNASRNTLRADHSALGSFFGYLVSTGARPDNPTDRVPLAKRATVKLPPAPPAAVAAAAHKDERTLLMTLLMSDMGLRRCEVARIHTRDITTTGGTMVLTVHGKGDKDRRLPVVSETVIRLIRRRIARIHDGWLFPSRNHSVDSGQHLRPCRVGEIVREATGFSCHAFRRKFGTDLWQATGDVMIVKELLGHASLATTQRYIWTTQSELTTAMRRLDRQRKKEQNISSSDIGY